MKLEPDSGLIAYLAAINHYWARDIDSAAELIERALELEPQAVFPHWLRALIFSVKGHHDEAISATMRAVQVAHHHPLLVSALGAAYARAGKRAEAEELINELDERSRREYIAPIYIADVYLALDRVLEACKRYERAAGEHNPLTAGVAMDSVHNRALVGLSTTGGPGFQILNLNTASPYFGTAFASPYGEISEDTMIDPNLNLLLSASEHGNYELVKVVPNLSAPDLTFPAFFENSTSGGVLDSSAEDCSAGIALAPAEYLDPTSVFLADLTHATFSTNTWTAPSQNFSLTGSNLNTTGASGPIAVAQGTGIGVLGQEFGGSANTITAFQLNSPYNAAIPFHVTGTTPGWITCNLGGGFMQGDDPHTLTAYQSPNGANHAFAVIANFGGTRLAVVDLTLMTNGTVPYNPVTHVCTAGVLPLSVVTFR